MKECLKSILKSIEIKCCKERIVSIFSQFRHSYSEKTIKYFLNTTTCTEISDNHLSLLIGLCPLEKFKTKKITPKSNDPKTTISFHSKMNMLPPSPQISSFNEPSKV